MSESRFFRHASVFSNAIFQIFRNNIVFFFCASCSLLFDIGWFFSAQTQFLDYLLHLLYSHSVSTPFASQPASPRPAGFHSQCPSVDHLNDLLKLFLWCFVACCQLPKGGPLTGSAFMTRTCSFLKAWRPAFPLTGPSFETIHPLDPNSSPALHWGKEDARKSKR